MQINNLFALLKSSLIGVLFLAIPSVSLAEVPAELVIGVPPFQTEDSFLNKTTLAHRIILQAVTDPLLVANSEKGAFSMIFSDSFQVDADGVIWSFRVRDGMSFSNGSPVQAVDLCYSLMRCGVEPMSESGSIELCTVRAEGIEGSSHDWIDVRFSGLPEKKARQLAVVKHLSSCPILQQKSSKVFSTNLAKGSNLIAAGEFRVSGFVADKNIQIERFQRDSAGRVVPRQVVEIKSFSSMKDALTALRVGTIALFFNKETEVEKAALADETLRVSDCGTERIVYRRGFQFNCRDVIILSSISWDLAIEH